MYVYACVFIYLFIYYYLFIFFCKVIEMVSLFFFSCYWKCRNYICYTGQVFEQFCWSTFLSTFSLRMGNKFLYGYFWLVDSWALCLTWLPVDGNIVQKLAPCIISPPLLKTPDMWKRSIWWRSVSCSLCSTLVGWSTWQIQYIWSSQYY